MADVFDSWVPRLQRMVERSIARLAPWVSWGNVTALSPLTVQLDSRVPGVEDLVDTLVSGLTVGDRVHVLVAGGRGVILGRRGGGPAGVIQAFGGSVAPSGWLLCHGQVVSRAKYARLFSVIGTTYGGGDGSTTFNVPDLRSRFPLGYASGAYALGATGGEATHTLTVAEMPAHAHGQVVTANTGGTGVRRDWVEDGAAFGRYAQGVETSPAGGGQAHNNMPPYLVIQWIISV